MEIEKYDNRVEYEFSKSDIREALISHFKIKITNSSKLWIGVYEGFLSEPPTVSMVIEE